MLFLQTHRYDLTDVRDGLVNGLAVAVAAQKAGQELMKTPSPSVSIIRGRWRLLLIMTKRYAGGLLGLSLGSRVRV